MGFVSIPSIALPWSSNPRRRFRKTLTVASSANRAASPQSPNDGLLELAAIALFRRTMSPHVGRKSPLQGYAGLVEESRMLLAKYTPIQQRRIVNQVLSTLFAAPGGPFLFRMFFAKDPELSARATPMFFQWLVGPAVQNSSPEGGIAGSGVYIEKCRFLDESGCKGLCLNLCQQPTQQFFTENLGLPLRMTPNFEDKSCQMSFGLDPLPLHKDPAHQGSCLEGCKMTGLFKSSRETKSKERFCYTRKTKAARSDALPQLHS